MSPRRRKRALIPLQAASSRLGQWGRDSRFYSGRGQTRRQREKLKASAAATPPLQFNTIKPTVRWLGDALPDLQDVGPAAMDDLLALCTALAKFDCRSLKP